MVAWMNAIYFFLKAKFFSFGVVGWKPSRALFAGFLVLTVVSCTSVSYADKASHERPMETGIMAAGEASSKGSAENKADTPDNTVFTPGMDRTAGASGLPDRNKGTIRIPDVSTNETEDVEDDIPFRDLPEVTIDESILGKKTIVGHDALIETELKRLLREFGEDKDEVDIIFLNEVKFYVKAFQTNDRYRRFVTNSLKRSARYMPAVKEVFKKRNLPEDMAFIAFLESGFNTRARSHAGALGMWQFMPDTARRYSLRVSNRIDERLDPVKSTYAAVEYFHDLIAIFGPRSFLLALAAYNCGEWRIIRCLKKIDNPLEERNFWHIRSCLARETQEYPPKIIAAAVIGSNPEVFGFSRYDGNDTNVEMQTAFANYKTLENVKQEVYPSAPQATRKGKGSPGIAEKKTFTKPEKSPARKQVVYMVKKNNTLSMIADIFGVDEQDIKRWNRMKNNRVVSGQKLKIYPSVQIELIRYKVRRGDTITDICQSFKVRPANLVATNGLRNGWDIKEGQKLVIYRTAAKGPVVYNVKKGDSLKSISDKFGVSTKDIMRWNNIKGTLLRPKQQLKIYSPS